MKNSEALSLVALLQAYYPGPGRELPDSTVTLWADALEKYQLGDGTEAVQKLASHGAFMPALAEVEREIQYARNDRLQRENENARALAATTGDGPFMSMTEWLADEQWHDDPHGHIGHLRSVRKVFPSLVRTIYDRAEAAELGLVEAQVRLRKPDYHASERIDAAAVVVQHAMTAAGFGRPVGTDRWAAFE